MKMVIVGGGKVGWNLARIMLERRHTVSLIERDRQKCEKLADELDAQSHSPELRQQVEKRNIPHPLVRAPVQIQLEQARRFIAQHGLTDGPRFPGGPAHGVGVIGRTIGEAARPVDALPGFPAALDIPLGIVAQGPEPQVPVPPDPVLSPPILFGKGG